MSLLGDAHFSVAQQLHREERFAEAIAAYRAALSADPQAPDVHYGLARALLASNDVQRAVQSFQRAFELDPAGKLDRRECLDVFRFLDFQELPQFWYADLEEFFARPDVDKFRYAKAGLNALMAKPEFRKESFDGIMADRLFRLLLEETLVADARFERLLTRLRKALLLDVALRERAPVEFLASLALQCFLNEFVYDESPAEREAVASLGNVLDTAGARGVAVYAMYRQIHGSQPAQTLAQGSESPGLGKLLRRAVLEVLEERRLREQVPRVGEISDAVSIKVRAQYEANPYPRWLSFDRPAPALARDWIRADAPGLEGDWEFPSDPQVLVAGCGSGAEALRLADAMREAQVTGVDLSRASLAYAMRMGGQLGIRNARFVQADILELDKLDNRFDVIYCSGVLHHMADPAAGLRSLCRRLAPGGLMRLGLYTPRGRSDVNAARELIARRGIEPSPAAIRAFRQEVIRSARESPLQGLLQSRDFYAMSECRDLLFHTQEHQLDLPRIASLLAAQHLSPLGLSRHLPRTCMLAYRRTFPNEESMTDLLKWDAVEAKFPAMFRGMVFVWCRRPTYNGRAQEERRESNEP